MLSFSVATPSSAMPTVHLVAIVLMLSCAFTQAVFPWPPAFTPNPSISELLPALIAVAVNRLDLCPDIDVSDPNTFASICLIAHVFSASGFDGTTFFGIDDEALPRAASNAQVFLCIFPADVTRNLEALLTAMLNRPGISGFATPPCNATLLPNPNRTVRQRTDRCSLSVRLTHFCCCRVFGCASGNDSRRCAYRSTFHRPLSFQ